MCMKKLKSQINFHEGLKIKKPQKLMQKLSIRIQDWKNEKLKLGDLTIPNKDSRSFFAETFFAQTFCCSEKSIKQLFSPLH